MPISQPTFRPGNIVVTGASTPKITNLDLINANTEYSHNLQTNLNQLIIRSRGASVIKIAFVSTESGINFMTIPKGTTLFLDGLSFSGIVLYAQASISNEILEILELY